MTFTDLRAPSFRLLCILLVALLAAFLITQLATQQMRLGYAFEPGALLKGDGASLTIEALDLTPEPGELSADDDVQRFHARQDQLANLIRTSHLLVEYGGKIQALRPHPGSWKDLPHVFWIQLTVGLGAFLISGWIWSLRSRDIAARLFFLSGFATLCFTFAAAVYTTRELALPSSLFLPLVALNEFGASLFGMSTLALFLVYPHRFKHSHAMILGQAAVFGLWTAAAIFNIIPAWLGVNLITLVEMLGICVALTAQFRATRRDPKARASLSWIGLSVLFGAGIFIALNATPLVFGQSAAIEQAYAFLSFLLIYLGLAAGIYRFRLFDVGRWAYLFLFYVLGAFLLLALDAALITSLGVDRLPALSLAFFVVGLFYLPLRDTLQARLRPKAHLKAHEVMEEVLQVAFASSLTQRVERWKLLLGKVFNPLDLEVLDTSNDTVRIEDNGLSLVLPRMGEVPSLKISYQSSGRSLFSPESCKLASQIVHLIERAESNRKAYDRGVIEERRRMAQDLHDDVGARLLTALYKADANTRPALEDVLADLREIVGEMNNEALPLHQILADLRYETSRRLAVARIDLDWSSSPDDPDFEQTLAYREHKALRSGLRELVSNVIRHAEASRMEVALLVQKECVNLRISDDGKGLPPSIREGNGQGYGLKILQQRIAALGGTIQMETPAQGSSFLLKIPTEIPIPPGTGGDMRIPTQ